jgi:UDP:flavonoid glycosyltransferase YjiC (YdhE family)
MSRILITWELGLNLGHLARLLPVATKLKERGHAVLVAVRDMQAAASVLGPAGISFVQAPHLTQGIALPHRPTGYADILLSQGWADRSTLWGLVHGWVNLYRMFRPDVLLMDYSPTATLAARIAQIPRVLVGNGFELPPSTNPLPPFPDFPWATAEGAMRAERLATVNATAVAQSFSAPPLEALKQLFDDATVLLATFPELDHYGSRQNAQYIGPLLGKINTQAVDWPASGHPKRIFACLRPDTEQVASILGAFMQTSATILCFVSGFSAKQLEAFQAPHIRFTQKPVDLDRLETPDLCVSYGAEGTVMTYLLKGVPQMIAPKQVEAHMAARRVQALGAGITLRNTQSVRSITDAIDRLLGEKSYSLSAAVFREHRASFNKEQSMSATVDILEQKTQKQNLKQPAAGVIEAALQH